MQIFYILTGVVFAKVKNLPNHQIVLLGSMHLSEYEFYIQKKKKSGGRKGKKRKGKKMKKMKGRNENIQELLSEKNE